MSQKPIEPDDEALTQSEFSWQSPCGDSGPSHTSGGPSGGLLHSPRLTQRSSRQGSVRVVTDSSSQQQHKLSFKWVDEISSSSSERVSRDDQDQLDISKMIDNEMVAAMNRESEAKGLSVSVAHELERVFFALQEEARNRPSTAAPQISEIEFNVGRLSQVSESVHRLPVRAYVLDAVTSIVRHDGGGLCQKHFVLPRVCKQIFDYEAPAMPTAGSDEISGGSRRSSLGWILGSSRFRAVLRSVAGRTVESTAFSMFFFLLTFYALFVPDLVSAFGSKDMDLPFSILNTVVWICFVAELVVYALGVPGYCCTLAALLDLVSLLSFLSDTWLFQGNLFGSQVTRVTRYARSARIARLVRIVRVLRATRILPQIMLLLGLSRNDLRLAKALLTRRIQRIFLYLDTDGDGSVGIFDFHILYVCLLLQIALPADYLSFDKSMKMRMGMLRTDTAKLSDHFTHGQKQESLSVHEFCHALLTTGLGKLMINSQTIEASGGDSGWVLTQRFSDAISLKVCLGLLLIVLVVESLETSVIDMGPDVALNHLVALAEMTQTTDVDFLCSHVAEYANLYSAVFIFLWNMTYFDADSAVQCESGRTISESDPFGRMSSIISNRGVRDSYLIQSCSPNGEYDEDSMECKVQARGAALLDNETATREESMIDLTLTVLVISCLCLWLLLFNRTVTGFSQTLLKPLHALVDDMNAMTSLELVHLDADANNHEHESKKPWQSSSKMASEVLHLENSFKRLRTSIRSWAKYVPPAIVQRLFSAGIEATLGVSKTLCSILFCDIEGFEFACKDFNPKEVLSLLTHVFSGIGDVIQREGGTLLEFIGDEILAVYSAPTHLKNHSYHAARSALEIHRVVRNLNLVAGGCEVRCRCGVHTAVILAGNVGSQRRMKYGLLGDGVNLTARMKGLNSRYDTQTLASAEVAADSVVRDSIHLRPIDKVAVKGRDEATTVYELLGLSKSQSAPSTVYRVAARRHMEAFTLYYDRKFAEARERFEEVRVLMKQAGREVDEPSRQMMDRCRAYIKQPPGDSWDGVERLKAKSFAIPAEELSEHVSSEGTQVFLRSPSSSVSQSVSRDPSDLVIRNLEQSPSTWVEVDTLQGTAEVRRDLRMCCRESFKGCLSLKVP